MIYKLTNIKKFIIMKKYITYVSGNENVTNWINTVLKNYLKKNAENENEIQHILDYLVSKDAPKRMNRMSYKEAVSNSEKWMKTQIKKGNKINELPEDIEVVLVLENGFKWVKLVGENAYKREGFLMRHCVASYFGKDVEIYSLRDKDNNPHCTVEKDQQIKGKGNGSIHPKYISYVVSFLEWTGMDVSDNEMKNLGYINISKFVEELSKETLENSYKNLYVPIDSILLDRDGNLFYDFDLWKNTFDADMNVVISDEKLEIGAKRQIDSVKDIVANGDCGKSVANGYEGKSVANGYEGKSVANGYEGKSVANGEYGESVANGEYGKSVANGDCGKSVANGEYGKSVANGEYGKSVADGTHGKSVANGNHGKSVANGEYGKSVANGNHGKSVADGTHGKSVANGYEGKSVANGDHGKSVANGYEGKSVANGNHGKSVANGDHGKSVANGDHGIACALGEDGKARGTINSWLILTEYKKDTYEILDIQAKMVDGITIKENTFYKLVGGKFVESENV